MKKSDLQVLLIVLGIAFAVLSWNFIYNSNNEKTEAIKIENETVLQPQITRLEELDANKDEYVAETGIMKEASTAIEEAFPANVMTEDQIMYYNNMEFASSNQIGIPSVTMSAATELPYSGTTTVEEFELEDDGIHMYAMPTSIGFTTTYAGLKNVVDYIYEIPGRKAINNISISASGDGYLAGAMDVDFYYMLGTEILYNPETIPAVPVGKENLFGVLVKDAVETAEEAE